MADHNPMEIIVELQWATILQHLASLTVAYVLALPIAWDQEKRTRSAGLRTFPLVAVATCAYMLVGIEVFDTTDAEARVAQGLITGMGFIGGGAILKHDRIVTGTSTAAALWGTGAIGMAVAFKRLEIAFVVMVVTFLTFMLLSRVKKDLEANSD